MAGPIGTTEYTTKPKYLTPEYEVERDGHQLLCQMVAYRGQIYEFCRDPNGGDPFKEIFPEPLISEDDPIHAELVAYLNRLANGQRAAVTP